MIDRLNFSLLLAFVILCIALDAFAQAWIEWKRLLWGELAMASLEKIRLTVQRAFSAAPR
jgi:hypothetical protein